MDKLTSEEVAIVGAEALKRLTCTVVQEKCTASASVYGSSSNTRPAKKEELHNKVLHSVSSRTARQDEISGVTPVSSGPVFTVSSPSPCGFPCRQFSSSVDSSPPLTASMVFSNAEVVEQCLVTGTESPPNRPNTLSLQREVSTASSTGSGKTTPCNIPGRSSCSHPSAKESLVATYPPRTASCYMSPMQAGSMAASVDRQPQCQLEGGIQAVHRKALARKIAEKLRTMGDHLTIEADMQHVTDLLESIMSDTCSWSWLRVARIFRGLSRILARFVDGGADSDTWELFSDVWKLVLRNLFGLIADNGGWQSFMMWAESDPETPPHPTIPTSFTPDLSRRRNTTDAVIHYSTPQVPRRSFPVTHSTPYLTSACGSERGSRVLSLTEEGIFQMEEQTSLLTGSSREQQQDEELQGQEDGTFGSLSSFSDMSGSPTSVNPVPCLLSETDQSLLPSAFDRNRSKSFPCRRRPRSASVLMRPFGLERTEVIAEQDRSIDSGLEAFSEASLTSADSCTSIQYSRLGVSATCILEAVRSMLVEK